MSDIKFAEGVKVKKVSDTLFGVSIKFKEFSEWAFKQKNGQGYINLNIRKSKDKEYWYCTLNDWKPENKEEKETVEFREEEIPF